MTGTTSRALTLLSLLQSRRTWTGAELMDRLGVSERTLRRDIDRLRDLGYQVRAVSGPAGGYHLEAGADIPPLLLDEEEAVAIGMGLLTAASGTIVGLQETSVRALAKLEQVLPPALRQRIRTLQVAVTPQLNSWVSVDLGTLTVVAQACRDHERLRFDYTARDAEPTERHVEPHQLVWLHQRWYLLAHDRDRDDWRTFRLDRLANARPTRLGFQPRSIPGGDAVEFVTRSIRSVPTRYQMDAVVDGPIDAVRARVWAPDATLADLGDGRTRLQSGADHLEWLVFQLLWVGLPFEILHPPELVAYLGNAGDLLARSAGGN
jgi:predicted DNA-binding transcriptional regulator YafY